MPSTNAQKIAFGHAWSKHRAEFPEYSTEAELSQLIDEVMSNPTVSKVLTKGRIAFGDEKTKTIVITDPNNLDGGTAFRPNVGKAYFDNLK